MALLTIGADKGAQATPVTGALPSVNLLPEAVVERARARRVLKGFAVGAVAVALASAGVWYAQSGDISAAQGDLASAQQANVSAQHDLEPLQAYAEFSAAVERQKQSIATTMAGELSFGRALDAFAKAWPAGTSARTLNVDTTQSCPGPDPFTQEPTLGCLTFGVSVKDTKSAEYVMTRLAQSDLLVAPYLTSENVTDQGVEVNGTVSLKPTLLTHRYDSLLGKDAQ